MANIASILTALGNALVGGNANIPLDIRNNPLAAAAYNTGTINQRNIEAARAIDQQRASQEGSQFTRQAAAAMIEKIYSFMATNRFVLQVTGQLPMFQKLLNAYTQSSADGDTSHLTGLPSLQEMMDEAAKQSHRFDRATDMDLTMMGATPEDIKNWRVNHPVPGTIPASLSHPAPTLTTPGSVTGLGNPVSHPQLTAPPLLQAPTSGPKVGYTDLTSTTPSPVLGAVPVTSMSNAPAGGWGDATNYPPGYDVTAAMPDPLAAQLYQQTLGAPEMQGLAGPLPARAGGGPVTAGQPYVVGDGSGSETLVPGLLNPPPMGGAPASVPQPSGPPPGPAPGIPNLDLNPTALPDNPVESASPGFGNFATALYQKGLHLLNSFQTLTPKQAQMFASQMIGDVYSDPAVVASRLDLGNTLDPRFASTPDDTAAAQTSYMTALKGATDKAAQLLTARMMPYTAVNDSNQKQLDELNKLGTTIFGSEGVGGTVGKLTTAGLEPSKTSAANVNELAQATEHEQQAYLDAQKAYQVAPNAETQRQLDMAGAKLRDAQAREADARNLATRQDAVDRWTTLQHTIDMDKIKVVDPFTAKLVAGVVHPRMVREMQGQSSSRRGAITGIGGIIGAGLGLILSGGNPAAALAGGAAGASLGNIGGSFGESQSTRSGNTNRDQVFDPGIGYALLGDPRFHDQAERLFQGYRNSPGSVDGYLPGNGGAELDQALAGSAYVMRDKQSPGYIMQQQRTLKGADLQTFNDDIRAYRSWGSKLGAAGAKFPDPVLGTGGSSGGAAPPLATPKQILSYGDQKPGWPGQTGN